jgi:hypothetical protein
MNSLVTLSVLRGCIHSGKYLLPIAGLYSKWSKWAQDTVGQYAGGKKNPAAEAAAYIEKKRPGSSDEEL